MTESDLVAALRPVTEALGAVGVRWYLGGSLASSAHGIARASLDADLIAELEPDHVDRFASRLEAAYYVPIDHMRAADADRDYLRRWAPALGVAELLERALADAQLLRF